MERIILEQTDPDVALDMTVDVLRRGGVVAAPTETVYGLMTAWDCDAGRERIYRMKARPVDRRLQMLAESVAVAQRAGLVADVRLKCLATRFWPGPLTIVGRAVGGDTIGLRVPDHPFLAGVLARLSGALAATSANRSGEPAALTGPEAASGLVELPDLLVDGGPVGGHRGGVASTVVDLSGDVVRVLRAGPISEVDILAALEEC